MYRKSITNQKFTKTLTCSVNLILKLYEVVFYLRYTRFAVKKKLYETLYLKKSKRC